MGRKKSYDRDDLIHKAMDIFRSHGFGGTSAEMLVEGLGVNRYGIYAEFGSKQGLFEAALERYDEVVIGRAFGPLEAPEAGIDEIRALLEFYRGATKGPAAGRGCLLCNTAVELGADDPSGKGFVKLYFKRLSSAFRNALSNAQSEGDLHADVDTKEEANHLTATVLGLFVMLRAKAPKTVVESAANAAIAHLESLR